MFISTFGDQEYGIVRLEGQVPKSMEMNPLAIISKNWIDISYYGRDGKKLGVKPISGHTLSPLWLWRILSMFTTKPRTVAFQTIDLGIYSIDELKTTIIRWLSRDDDILTQFLDGRQIEQIMSQATTFDEMLLAVRAFNGEHESDPELFNWLKTIGVTELIGPNSDARG